jgi:hypothetical protein
MQEITVANPQVFIPSRGRPNGARKLTQAWHEEGFDVNWVVERREHDDYFDKIVGYAPISGPPDSNPPKTHIHILPVSNAGIGFARNHCVSLAGSFGCRSIILADDDIKPSAKGGGMQGLVDCAKHSKVLGITAKYSYHDLCLGDKIKGRNDLILLPTGTFRLVALNVNNVLDLGNYDHTLEYAEDCDLFLRGLAAGYPWMIHLGTWSNSIGTRYQPGGMLDFAGGAKQLKAAKADWHETLHEQYPEFTNEHDDIKCAGKQNCIRISWKKAYNELMPGWQKYSALHGGYLNDYFGVPQNG